MSGLPRLRNAGVHSTAAGISNVIREGSMRSLILLCLPLSLRPGLAQRPVHFPVPNGQGEVQADLYGAGTKALILAHGGRFNKESWRSQAEEFARAGFLVLAIRFRGDALNPDGSPSAEGSDADNATDVLAAAA